MSAIPHLVGMVHLLPLPGSPGFAGSMADVLGAAVSDAGILAESGFPALMVENFGDVPFHADEVPSETVASMTLAVHAVMERTGLPVGVNVLRNDLLAAIGVASATGAAFVRTNVLTGVMYTDQGPIVGRAAEALRKRAALCPDVEVWADVLVKHATPPSGLTARQAAQDTVERGLADAVIVSGQGTGAEPDLEEARLIRDAVPESVRLAIGSGADADNLAGLTDVADTVIVGSSVKFDGDARNRVDPDHASSLVQAARGLDLI